tara:strand:+ start:202 stop:417 length:216 start_codon:yes stop_codon:yes gene_type:complete
MYHKDVKEKALTTILPKRFALPFSCMITDARPENQARKEKPIRNRPFIANPELSVDHISNSFINYPPFKKI